MGMDAGDRPRLRKIEKRDHGSPVLCQIRPEEETITSQPTHVLRDWEQPCGKRKVKYSDPYLLQVDF